MSQRFKRCDRDQLFLLPPSLREWLPPGDLAYFIIDVVDHLDLKAIYQYYQYHKDPVTGELRAKAASGQCPFEPKMMVALILYAYCLGTPSSRTIAALCERDAGYRIVAANQQPDFRTISEFRRIHLKTLKGLFVQVLHLACEVGLVRLGHVSLDGTKIKANASKHKAMSYGRMQEREAQYQQEVEELLNQAQQADASEDERYGPEVRGDELPKEIQFREARLAKIRQAKQTLEEAARAEAQAEGKLDEQGQSKPPARGRPAATPPGVPKPQDQENFTDPESNIMKMGDGAFDQAYNGQVAVEESNQIIVAQGLTPQGNDKQQVQPMVEQIKENLGGVPQKLSGDSGFYSEANVLYVRKEGIDDYLCPDRIKHGEPLPSVRGRPPAGLSFTDRVRRKLLTKQGRRTYGLRKQIVEPVFGQIKQARGLRQFLLRGVQKVQGEWSLWCTGHNLLKIWAAVNA